MANEYYWKVWLRPNLLTKDDDNDYIAEVLTQKDTLHNENIANAIIKEGSEIKYDPSRIIARVPALTDGKYRLRIVTQFSKGVTLLKSPRTIEYKLPLTVGAGGGDSESPDEI